MGKTRKKFQPYRCDDTSEKSDKKYINKKIRKLSKKILNIDPENYVEPKQEEILDVWNMSKGRP